MFDLILQGLLFPFQELSIFPKTPSLFNLTDQHDAMLKKHSKGRCKTPGPLDGPSRIANITFGGNTIFALFTLLLVEKYEVLF